jgi:hemin uptake protein HemP
MPLNATRRSEQPERRTLEFQTDAAGGWWVSSSALLGPDGRLSILHQGELYLLRLTRQGKLILTK